MRSFPPTREEIAPPRPGLPADNADTSGSRDSFLTSRQVAEGAGRPTACIGLSEYEDACRLLIEHSPAITYIAAPDEDSSTRYASPQIERVLGFSQAEWMDDPT